MEREQIQQWTLSDEELCELCFMVVELGQAQQQLMEVLLGEDRPSLNEIWVSGNALQQQSQQVFTYLGQRLRQRAIISEHRAA